jgi:hypothetical protein
MIARLSAITAWLTVGHALLAALFWLLLTVPESNVVMLGASAALAVAMLAWAFSRPLLGDRRSLATGDGGDVSRVVVLDASASMSAVQRGIESFERGRAVAAEHLAGYPESALFCPGVAQLCQRAGRPDRLAAIAREQGDLVNYTAAILQARHAEESRPL